MTGTLFHWSHSLISVFLFFPVQLMLSEYDSVAMALSQLDDWHTAAVPLITLIESLPRHRLDVIEKFLSSTQQGINGIIAVTHAHTPI